MPETKRLFVAIFPPAEIVTRLQAAAAGLGKGLPARSIRLTLPDQIHLTVHFLGAIQTARIPEIESALASACRGHQRCHVRVAGLGCFPNSRRPRILWAGLAGDLQPVENLQKAVQTGFLALRFAGEDRPFQPHLTIGRVSELNAAERIQLAAALEGGRDRDFGQWDAGRVDLMQSVLSPQGAAYSALKSIPLENP